MLGGLAFDRLEISPVVEQRQALMDLQIEDATDGDIVISRLVLGLELQSIQACTPSRIGDPLGPGRHTTSRHLSDPLRLKSRQSSAWSAARILMQNAPAFRMTGEVVETLEGEKATSGGSIDRLKKLWQVMPANPSSPAPVTTVTPEQKCPRTLRK